MTARAHSRTGPTRAAFVILSVAALVVIAWLVLGCVGSTTTLKASGYGIDAELVIERAAKLCEPGEDWETCIPKCTASSAAEPAPSGSTPSPAASGER